MKKIIQREVDRGGADHGWLKAKFSFSFAHYYNPENINFGALRVLNDDIIQGGMGFGTHPHDNMEIITIPLEGALKHRDSMSKKWIPLYTGEVQIMSAGKGIQHAEMNNDPDNPINLFQIWIVPNKKDVTPRYDQQKFNAAGRKNKLQVLVSSIDAPVEGTLNIHQDAKISRIDLDENSSFKYILKSENHGVYIMVIEGAIAVENEVLSKRDAIGIFETKDLNLISNSKVQLLFIEVPMQL